MNKDFCLFGGYVIKYVKKGRIRNGKDGWVIAITILTYFHSADLI